MKVLSILGTSSNSGKSWMTTAICAWLRRQGYRVAPFKAQNMSNNSYVTFEGHEIGRAQAAQAEACGLRPISAMNPILLKPSGKLGSQLIIQGKAEGHLKATEYYQQTDRLWKVVTKTLEEWKSQTDVLVMEGAGSPVELNLLHRDIVNLRPVHHTDGRWILVSDIERGGVFAQIVGTWQLLNEADRARGLGVIVNKFRGDLSLFSDIEKHLLPHTTLPYLGVLPFDPELQPESEDSLCQQAEEKEGDLWMAWIRFPHLSNSQDAQPWKFDSGIGLRWVDSLQRLEGASMIVLPGSKNTIADLEWLRKMGLDRAIIEAAKRGIPVIGICGGYQILGETLRDPAGIAGDSGEIQGLG
ncbi:MAG: cobyric acid synthase, partial [Verrucomicrobiota bacterium]